MEWNPKLNQDHEKKGEPIRAVSRATWQPTNYWFTMHLTDRCNQSCLHCTAGVKRNRKELSTVQWFKIIQNLETSLRRQGRRGGYTWFGGEAACREDIYELIQYCGDRQYLQSLFTNGILFDDELANFCALNGMKHVYISLDSADPVKTNKIRGVPQAFDFARQAIQNARKHKLMAVVVTTVMKYNIDELEAIKNFIKSMEAVPYFRAVIKQKNAAANWNEIGLNRDQYQRFHDFKYKPVLSQIREGKTGTLDSFGIYDMTPFMEHPPGDVGFTALELGVGCQACRSRSGIDIDGDVFPCAYPSTLTIGNALTQGFEAIMKSPVFKAIRDRKRDGKCAHCHHLDFCGGGCRVQAECETGDFFAPFSYCGHESHSSQNIKILGGH